MKGLRHLGRDGVYQGTSAFTDQAVRGHRVQLNAINCRDDARSVVPRFGSSDFTASG